MLCDPSATLIGAIGLKKTPKGTTRGVFVVDKSGKVLAAEAGSPDGTVDVVTGIVDELKGAGPTEPVDEDGDAKMEDVKEEDPKEDKAEVAKEAEVKSDDAAVAATKAEEKEEGEEGENVVADEKKVEEVNGEAEKKEEGEDKEEEGDNKEQEEKEGDEKKE